MEKRRFIREPPVKVGDELEVTIEAIGEKGDGVAKVDGYVVFVPKVSQGDKVTIKITKILPKMGFAERIANGEG